MLYSAYLQTMEPPHFYDAAEESDFHHSVRAFLHQVSRGDDEDVTNAAANLVESLFDWLPPLGFGLQTQVAVETPATSSSMGLNVCRPSLNSLRTTITESVRHTGTALLILFQTWDSYSRYSSSATGSPFINFSAPDPPGQEEHVLGAPELRLTASTKTESKEGVKHTWRLAALIVHVKHYKLNSRLLAGNLRSPTSSHTILAALSEATGLLAKSWMECGTFWSLVMVNSRFSRLCVLDVQGVRDYGEGVSGTITSEADVQPIPHDSPVVFTMALEVSPWLLHQHFNGCIDLSTLIGTDVVNPELLLCHDMIFSYHATANRALETQKEHSLNHESMAILWGSLVRAIDLIGKIPMGEPLRRLDDSSETFKNYSNQLLGRSQEVVLSRMTSAREPSSTSRTHVPVRPETLEPLPEPLIRLNDTREQHAVSSTRSGSHSEFDSFRIS